MISKKMHSPFQTDKASLINEARKQFLDNFLSYLINEKKIQRALDVGCGGLGLFSRCLKSQGLDVIGFDARQENVYSASERNPDIHFEVYNIEDSAVLNLGSFSFVLCFGLLYHLENPFKAIRNLYELTERYLLIESRIAPHKHSSASFFEESHEINQSLHSCVLIPSEKIFVKMLYKAGFSSVFKAIQLPNHPEFKSSFFRKRMRTILLAEKESSYKSFIPKKRFGKIDFKLLLEPVVPKNRPYVWMRRRLSKFARIYSYMQIGLLSLICNFEKLLPKNFSDFLLILSKVWKVLRVRSSNIILRIPLPIRLPWGGWWLAWNDVMGKHIRKRDDFEQGERSFLLQFLKMRMTFLDIGAHQGFYTLLASKRIGPNGSIVAFEPSPRELQRLRWNLFLNRCRNVRVVPFALGMRERVAELYICLGQETGCNSLYPPAVSEPMKSISISVTTLDNYLQRVHIDLVDFIKLDVEGAEMEVLKGAAKLLSRRPRPIIMCELADIRTKPWDYRSVEIYEFLATLDYQWFSITLEGRLLPCPRKEHFHENLLAVPVEKLRLVTGFVEEFGKQCIDLP